MQRRSITAARTAGAALACSLAVVAWPPASAFADTTPPYGTSSNDSLAPCPAGTVACPSDDPFYAPPSDLASYGDGEVVRYRSATLGDPSPDVAAAYTIAYRSEDTFGAPVLDTATVLVPSAPYAGGARPLVSEQFAEDSVGAQCQPSYALAYPGTNQDVDSEERTVVTSLLAQGIEVVAPDYEGPAEQWEVGGQAGHAILDGIRATESFAPAGLSPATQVGINGYSGGAYATGWAGELASTYAPSLDIVGEAIGGTPADQQVTADYLNGTLFSGFLFLSTIGLDRAYPSLGVYDALNANGRAVYAQLDAACVNQGTSTTYAYKYQDDYTNQPDYIATPAVSETLAFDSLGQHPPTIPVFGYHAYNDEIVPYVQDQLLMKDYCGAGTPVEFTTLAGDHVSGESEGLAPVDSFFESRFAGTPFVDECPAILAAPTLPQVPPITLPSAGLPEAPAVPALALAGIAAGVLVVRRRRRPRRLA